MCNCQSYNMGGGEVPEVVLRPQDPALTGGKESVCVDACIADVIQSLWGKGLATLGCCCGHGSRTPDVVIPEHSDPGAYLSAIAEIDSREWNVLRWKLVTHKAKIETPDNKEFAEQIAAAMVALGTEEAMSCMSRVMCWVAADHGQPIQFECDLGVVTIEPKQQPLQS